MCPFFFCSCSFQELQRKDRTNTGSYRIGGIVCWKTGSSWFVHCIHSWPSTLYSCPDKRKRCHAFLLQRVIYIYMYLQNNKTNICGLILSPKWYFMSDCKFFIDTLIFLNIPNNSVVVKLYSFLPLTILAVKLLLGISWLFHSTQPITACTTPALRRPHWK